MIPSWNDISYYVFNVARLLFSHYIRFLSISVLARKSSTRVRLILARSAVWSSLCRWWSHNWVSPFEALSFMIFGSLSQPTLACLLHGERIGRQAWGLPCWVLVPLCQRNAAWQFEKSVSVWSEGYYFVSTSAWDGARMDVWTCGSKPVWGCVRVAYTPTIFQLSVISSAESCLSCLD